MVTCSLKKRRCLKVTLRPQPGPVPAEPEPAKPEPEPETFASSAFHSAYAEAGVPGYQDQILAAVRTLLCAYCAANAQPVEAALAFFERLQREAFGHAEELLEAVPGACQRLWTSAEKLTGVAPEFRKELCSILNSAIRDGSRMSDAMPPAATLCRGINELCVTRRVKKADEQEFPAGGRCFRGGALPDEHRSFFKPGVKYRVPGMLATSFSEDVAYSFYYRAYDRGEVRPIRPESALPSSLHSRLLQSATVCLHSLVHRLRLSAPRPCFIVGSRRSSGWCCWTRAARPPCATAART